MKKLKFLNFYLIFFVVMSASFWSCQTDELDITPSDNNTNIVKGEGNVVTETLSLESFTGVDLAFANNIIISQGTSQEVKVTGHANIIENLKTEVVDDIWNVALNEGTYTDYELLVEITVPNINVLKLSGSGNMTVNDFTAQNGNLTIEISGSGQIIFNGFEGVTNLDVAISGSGSFIANEDISSLENLIVDITGSGDYFGYNISSEECDINVSSSGNVEITVINVLVVTISGSGNVSYHGVTISITENITGTGVLIHTDSGDTTNPCDNPVTGEGTITTETLTLDSFTGIDLMLANNVTVSQGSSQEIAVTGHPNIIDSLTKDIVDDIWRISLKEGCYEDYELSIHITVPNINFLKITGSGNITVNNFSDQNNLSANISGSGQITLNEFEGITSLDALISGSGDIVANKDISTLVNLNVDIMGSGAFLGYNISSPNCDVDIFGSGNVEVTATNTLIANIFGSGNISYKGSPSITQNIVGSGQLIDAN